MKVGKKVSLHTPTGNWRPALEEREAPLPSTPAAPAALPEVDFPLLPLPDIVVVVVEGGSFAEC